MKWLAVFALVCIIVGWALWTPDLDRALLEQRYLRGPADHLEVLGARLHVRVSGPVDKPAVVLLHGFGASLHTWEPWATALERDFRVVRLDFPGGGLSPPDPIADYSDTRSLQLLLGVLDALGIQRAHVVGHSMGGRIAWNLAARHPSRVDKLVLLAPDGFASPGFAYGVAPGVPAVMQLMRWTLPRWMLRMNLEPAYAQPTAMTDALLQRYFDLLRAPGARQAMLQRMEQTVLVDPVPLLRAIQIPTLLGWGEQDAMIPPANAQDYLKALPNARLVTWPGIGHLPQEEAAERTLPAVRDFLLEPI